MADVDLPTLLGGGATALIGGAGLWLANRLVGKAAVQTALNNGFKDLLTEIQEDRDYWRELVAVERRVHADEINGLKVAHAKEIALLEGQILNVTQGYESLKNYLRRQGIEVPSARMEPQEMIVLEGPKSVDRG